jgi:hypothetical protein
MSFSSDWEGGFDSHPTVKYCSDIDEIINIFGKCKSITGVILNMGIYDNTKNRNKLKLIKEKYKLEFK